MTSRSQRGLAALAAVVAAILFSACRQDRDVSFRSPGVSDSAAIESSAVAVAQLVTRWQVRKLDVVPARFRPAVWSDENTLWGLLRGRVTRIDVRTGEIRSLSATAWSVHGARGVVSWRNETGLWQLRNGGEPVRLSGNEPDTQGFEAPVDALWSNDGTRAVLAWQAEWDARHVLLEYDGSMRDVETKIPGYFGNAAALWLDAQRVLFHTSAMAPIGGEPTYSESGWRGNLAVLDLTTGQYKLVTGAPDSIYLRVAGMHRDEVLVTEWGRIERGRSIRGHWFYNPRTWHRRRAALPNGRAYTCAGGAAAVLLDENAPDTTDAVLIAGSDTKALGKVARDAQPACSPSGRRGALRTTNGVVLLFETVQ